MKLSRILLPLAMVAACAAARTPEKPWRIEVSTSGGLTGRGIGAFAVDSGGNVEVRRLDGKACSYILETRELLRIEELLAEASPHRWRDSYLPENTCCDRIISTMTIDENGDVVTTRWIDGPPPSPKDLEALANAIVGPEQSIRADSAERCK